MLIRDGIIDRKALHDERISLDELSMLARLAGIKDYRTIRLAIPGSAINPTVYPCGSCTVRAPLLLAACG